MWEALGCKLERKVLEMAMLRLRSVLRRADSLLLRATALDSRSLYFWRLLNSGSAPEALLFLGSLPQRASSLAYN
jgi:hypothetical protein